MRQVISAKRRRGLPTLKQWAALPRLLSRGERIALVASVAVFALSAAWLSAWYVSTHRVEIPTVGGEYVEALVGEPQFVNPLYASASDVDADLARLTYSGLLAFDPHDGLVNDLAEQVEISEDGKTYTVTLRDDARFHDGEAVRAKDVVFTFTAIQNPAYRSPLEVSFRSVAVSQVDDRTVAFSLEKPFAPFLSTLTVGILPEGLWGDISARNAPLATRNLEPVGSGPYKFASFAKEKNGAILSYTLVRNPDYYGTPPLIETLTFKFYADADDAVSALDNRNVEGVAFVPSDQEEHVARNRAVTIARPGMPRLTSLSFNQEKQPAFKLPEVRRAFAQAIDKGAVLASALNGHGTVAHGPILPGAPGFAADAAVPAFDPAAAGAALEKAGYALKDGATFRSAPSTTEPFSVTLKTVQQPELLRAAEAIASQLAAVGVNVRVDAVGANDLFASVIAPRDYEMLLTGALIGLDPDPYPFWHSSQASGNGLNLARYQNRKADELLEAARSTTDEVARATAYREFQDLLAADVPAVFLYQSAYAYAYPSKIKGVDIPRIVTPSDRFADVTSWYIKTKKVLR